MKEYVLTLRFTSDNTLFYYHFGAKNFLVASQKVIEYMLEFPYVNEFVSLTAEA